MLQLIRQEFLNKFLSLKTIVLVVFLTWAAYDSASTAETIEIVLGTGESSSPYILAFKYMLALIGYLLITIFTYDAVSKDAETRSLRLLLPMMKREELIIGKYLANILYWFAVTIVPMLTITVIAQQFFIAEYLAVFLFICTSVSLVFLISAVLLSSRWTLLINIIIGILMPIWVVIAFFGENLTSHIARFTAPGYMLVEREPHLILIQLVFILISLFIVVALFRKRDY